MNVCLIGDNLTSLSLAKILVNRRINVNVYSKNFKNKILQTRTVGISKNNLDFFNKEILSLKKIFFWNINQIEVYSEKYEYDKILNFEKNDKQLFSIFKNNDLYNLLKNDLKKNKLFKKKIIKNSSSYKKILNNQNYDLVINCDTKSEISKKFFNYQIDKNYDSFAYTTVLNHKNIKNKKAIQIFTKIGPIAFLPLSKNQTSIVFSILGKEKNLNENQIIDLITKYNNFYDIKNFSKIEKFNLNFSISRNYYNKNLMGFGDVLHKIHPLAGQGFNMTLRDIKIFSQIIQNRINLGLPLDSSIYKEFEKQTKHFNFAFAFGIDFIHEFFNFDSRTSKNYSNYLFKFIDKNRFINNFFSNYADKGSVL